MSSESDKASKEKNQRQISKSLFEPSKPNLRTRSGTTNPYNCKVAIQKKIPVMTTQTLNKDRTPIKNKTVEEGNKKLASEFLLEEKQLTEQRKDKLNFSLRDESPWTKFCKSDLSPLCKNTLLSPNRPTTQENDTKSQAKLTTRLIEYQTPSPSIMKKGEILDFSPFLNYTAKKVIQKLDFSNLDDKKAKNGQGLTNSVIVCFKSPTFNFLNKKYELEEDFIFSSHPKASLDKVEASSDPGDEDLINLVSKGPHIKDQAQYSNEVKQKQHEPFLKTMNKYKDADLECNIQTIKKITPFTATNEKKLSPEEINPKNLNLHSFYSTPKGSHGNFNSSNPNFRTPNLESIEFASNLVKNDEKRMEGNEETPNNELGESFQIPKKTVCNCKKSRCLKLYCDCFAASEFCSKDCNCLNCANVLENEEERYSSMMALMERNPTAFKPKYDKKEETAEKALMNPESIRHAKGCNCKKSNCLKKYCECYQAGIKCTDLCKCDTCKNHEGNNVVKKRKGNPMIETFSQFSEGKQEVGPNSFTFGYNAIFNQQNKEKMMEEFETERSNGSAQSFNYRRNSKTTQQETQHSFFQTPKLKQENNNLKKEKLK